MHHPTRSLLAALALSLPLIFLACIPADPGPDPDPRKSPVDTMPLPRWNPGGPFTLQGAWTERLDSGTLYFAGRVLSLDFEADSVTLREYQFTDVSDCQVDAAGNRLGCTDFRWTNTYRGAWTATGSGNPFALHIDFRFVGTTASPRTHNPVLASGRVDFEAGPAMDANQVLVLTRTSTGAFIAQETHFALYRPQ